jgi:hypothetical protein
VGDLEQDRALVAGELRGYRQFDLAGGRLLPVVHAEHGAWDPVLERARCAVDAAHDAPVAGCSCGLYAMYRPGSATVALGLADAVVAARGRCVLGDRGFRASAARIEAVALPMGLRWVPLAGRRARQEIAERYPGTRVYASARRMLREHPPHEVASLGIEPPPDRSRGYRAVAAAIWALFVVTGYAVVLLPRDDVRELAERWWPALVVGLLAWQAAFIWLLARLMSLQSSGGEKR